MAQYRGKVVQSGADVVAEVVVATGLCCATPFQVMQLNFGFLELKGHSSVDSSQDIRVTIQSKSGYVGMEDTGYLASWHLGLSPNDLSVPISVVLPVQSTTGDLVVRLSSDSTGVAQEVSYFLDVSFVTLKELEYFRLRSSGY